MPVAGFLNPLQPLAPPMPMAAAAAGGDAGSSGSLQGFVVPQQLQTEWCWAAVSSGVAAFYGPNPNQWTQCSIASAELAPLNCCGSDGPGACNQYGYLDRALTRVGHYDHMTASTSTFAGVQTEVGGHRPLGCRIAWAGGGAHFVALGGWLIAADGNSYVNVCDPFYGPVQKKYDDFVSAYVSPGDSWTHSYFTIGAMAVAGGGAPLDPNSPPSA